MAFSLNDYTILNEIGRGAFGTVYKAGQKSLDRCVAIKSLSTQKAQNSDDIMRFGREAQAMAKLSHDNVLDIYDYGFQGGTYYIVMQFIEGNTFEDALEKGIARPQALYILEKVADGLAYAHSAGIVHRDIKPGNILLGRRGQVKLSDFGLATFQQGMLQQTSRPAAIGTFAYMSPEAMVNPQDIDYRTDVFSFGCILYRVLSGVLPFKGQSIAEVSSSVLNEQPPQLQLETENEALAALAMKCLSKHREARPAIDEVQDAIRDVLGDAYHAARKNLYTFLQSGKASAAASMPALPKSEAAVEQPAPPSRRKRRIALSSLILAALAIGYVFVSNALRMSNMKRNSELPAMQSLDSFRTSLQKGPSSPTVDTSHMKDDRPMPLEGPDYEIEIGTLILRGLDVEDTVYINGKKLPAHRKGVLAFSLETGRNQIAIHGPQKSPLVRDLEIVPYQVVEWDVRKERNAHE
ncbi:MAG: protein kinase [Chitinivibrionales bacterium]|nr:protein kinase [Chitinivibrionales bacterium]